MFISSGFSISLILVGYAILANVSLSEPEQIISEFTVIQYFLGYLIHVVISSIIGVLSGVVHYKRTDEEKRRIDVWAIAFKEGDEVEVSSTEGDEVEVWVNTESGREIRGYVSWYGSGSENRDLLLKYPEWIIRDEDDGNKVSQTAKMGKKVFINEEKISEIYFPGVDRNQ